MTEAGSRLFFYSIFVIAAFNAGIASDNIRASRGIKRIFVLISFIILLIPLGMRKVGIDHEIYKEWFDNADFWLNEYYHLTPEPFFAALTLIAKDVFSEFQIVYFFAAFVYLAGLFVFLKRTNSIGYMSIFFMSFSLLLYMCGLARMSIAIGILCIAFTELDKKYMPLILIVIAMMFHYTAIIAVLVYISYRSKRKVSFKNIMYIIVGMFFMSYVINAFSGVLPYAIMRYANYVKLSFAVGNIKGVLVLFPAIILWELYKHSYVKLYGEKYRFYDNIIKIVFALAILSMMFDGVFRITFYFYPFMAKIYADFVKILKMTEQKVIIPVYGGLFTVVGLIYVYEVYFTSPYITDSIIPFMM